MPLAIRELMDDGVFRTCIGIGRGRWESAMESRSIVTPVRDRCCARLVNHQVPWHSLGRSLISTIDREYGPRRHGWDLI